MQLIPSDPDIDTLFSRIMKGDIDLQPDFQRGEVWSDIKKQRLIDSILREWHVPPIHVIEVASSAKQEVLDGQQRLAAIRDFLLGKLKVDGQVEPFSAEIASLDGATYASLPPEWQRRFGQFTIRVFRIVSYEPGEPYELFYRLNQPANLTAAEQRNAFFGPAREQVKKLSALFAQLQIDKEYIGFSNSRMAYDDVVARLCMSLENGRIDSKVTAAMLTERYRSMEAFSKATEEICENAIRLLAEARRSIAENLRLNKATLYSWLWFVSDMQSAGYPLDDPRLLGEFLSFFESTRHSDASGRQVQISGDGDPKIAAVLQMFMPVYSDRSSARVADASSVLARDAVIWIGLMAFLTSKELRAGNNNRKIAAIRAVFQRVIESKTIRTDQIVEELCQVPGWGMHL